VPSPLCLTRSDADGTWRDREDRVGINKPPNGTGHELSICLALKNGACIVARMRRDLAEAEWSIARLGDVANSISAQFWQSAA
jgi:hypothetical protein